MIQGFRNDFQEAMERDDEAYLNEILATKNDEDASDGTKPNAIDVKIVSDDLTYEEILELVTLFLVFICR